MLPKLAPPCPLCSFLVRMLRFRMLAVLTMMTTILTRTSSQLESADDPTPSIVAKLKRFGEILMEGQEHHLLVDRVSKIKKPAEFVVSAAEETATLTQPCEVVRNCLSPPLSGKNLYSHPGSST